MRCFVCWFVFCLFSFSRNEKIIARILLTQQQGEDGDAGERETTAGEMMVQKLEKW